MCQSENDDRRPDDDDFKMIPPDSGLTDYEPEIFPQYARQCGESLNETSQPDDTLVRQFSLAELLLLVTSASVFFSISAMLPGENRWEILAGTLSMGSLAYTMVFVLVEPSHRFFRLLLSMLLVLSLVACVVAVVTGLV